MDRRVYLRAMESDDYRTSVKWRKDDGIWSMLGGTKYFVSEAYEKKWVEDAILAGKDVRLAVCLNENDRHIGNVYMTDIDMARRSCSSGILIGERDCWGKGYGREALTLALRYMFYERNIHRVQALILEGNEQSLKMHRKCGYQVEGLMRESVFKNGRYRNQYLLSILKKDFDAANGF